MIKRIIACLTICLIITGLLSPVISHAEPIPIYTPNWNDPGIAEIISISDLTGWMANGGVYDLTSFQDLDEFLTWYFKIRVPIQDEDGNITFAPTYGYDSYLDSNYNSPRFIEQSNIRGMIGRSYQNKTGYGRRLQEQVDKALLEDGDLSNVNIPLLSLTEAAYFVGHDTNAIYAYRNSFNTNDSPNPQPDPNYISYINKMNGTSGNGLDFFWKNYASSGYSYYGIPFTFGHSFESFSYFCANPQYGIGAFVQSPFAPTNSTYPMYGTNILDLNIVSSGSDLYSLSVNLSSITDFLIETDDINARWYCLEFRGDDYNQILTNFEPNTTPYSGSYNLSNISLTDMFEYISNRFRNVNIYVDGVPWAIVGISSDLVVTPEFPYVVGGEDLPVTTWPLTVPKAPSYINLPGLRQAFQRAKNTDNEFDIMDLVDSLVDPEGDPVSDPEMETVPIPLPNPDPINPEVVPELPDLPLIPPANNPGFSGVSVLAEIINFTNQSLPSALITVFWGIVFGAVILGIIKILHK